MTNFEGYPVEELDANDDDGTMPENVAELAKNVVGRKIVSIDRGFLHDRGFSQKHKKHSWSSWESTLSGTALILDDGTKVVLANSDDCCAYTDLNDIILNLDKIEHAIMGVGTTEGYTKWHIYANLGDVVELDVGWSCGNPFYYGYGFDIYVVDVDGNIKDSDDD